LSIEGRLNIKLTVVSGGVTDVTIGSSRPLRAPEIFVGKRVEQLLETLPLLYSVCGTAQASAATQACEQALGYEPQRKHRQARELLVWMETAKEHLWQILLNWPTLLEKTPDSDGVAQIMALQRRFKAAIFVENNPFRLHDTTINSVSAEVEACIQELEVLLSLRLFNCPLRDWLELTELSALEQWVEHSPTTTGHMMARISEPHWAGLGAVTEESLPELRSEFFQQQLMGSGADQFIAAPEVDGESRESTSYTRQFKSPLVQSVRNRWGSGLFARSTARLQELAFIPTRLQMGVKRLQSLDDDVVTEHSCKTGVGIAQIEAARGRLVHRVELQDQRVVRYQIVAPTEWNFHPKGVLAKGLRQLKAETDVALRQRAIFLINAIDPCVGYDLTINSETG